MMKKWFVFVVLMVCANLIFAKGLRYSVCQVTPEYTDSEKATLSELALYFSRAGMTQEAHRLQSVALPSYYGSGVVVRYHDNLCLLTTRQVLTYAAHATVTVYLHDKTLRYRNCQVLHTDEASGLALVQLPKSDELEPLAITAERVEEGEDISCAGFTTLQDQPSWQLARGMVSNAALHMGNHLYVQHSAPFNIGMEGGPLLQKINDAYHIVGINVGAVTHREDMALSVAANEIAAALHSGFTHDDHAELVLCDKQHLDIWYEVLKQMTADELDSLLKTPAEMPLDPIVHILEMQDFYQHRTAKAKQERLNKRGVVSDISRFKQSFFYHNYLSAANQEAGMSMEFALGKRKMAFLGLQFAASFTSTRPIAKHPYGGMWGMMYYQLYDPKPVFTPLFGLYMGYQLPIRVGDKHVLVPRIAQGGNIGPSVNTYDEPNNQYSVGALLISSDSRFGLEYHYQMDKLAFIVAIEYTAHLYASGAKIVNTYKDGRIEAIDPHTQFVFHNKERNPIEYTCFNHGVGVRLAIGF